MEGDILTTVSTWILDFEFVTGSCSHGNFKRSVWVGLKEVITGSNAELYIHYSVNRAHDDERMRDRPDRYAR